LLQAHIKSHPDTPARAPPSRQQLIQIVLNRLKGIEEKIGNLNSSTSTALATIGSPIFRMTPFPLEADLEFAKTLESELSRIKTNFHEVHATKEVITELLDDLVVRLKAAKQQWREAEGRATHRPPVSLPPNAPLEYISGSSLHIF
jgi:hypothetical protein